MTVREFISYLNPEKVLDGSITFKVVAHGTSKLAGNKWFFYNSDEDGATKSKTIEEFVNDEGIKNCMDLEIIDDGYSCECHPYWEEGHIYYHLDVE